MMTIIQYIVLVLTLLVLDFIWITANQRMYYDMYSRVQNRAIQINKIGAVLAYSFIILTFILFVIPRVQQTDKSLLSCLIFGGLMGLCIYGVYNFTNMALLHKYSWHVSIIDTLWGCALFTIVSYIVIHV
jgi:uncharacterized membrane protein